MNERPQHTTKQRNQNRVLDTESRQMNKAPAKGMTSKRHNSLLANGLPLSFLCSFFPPKSLYTPLTFSHRCTSLFSPISAYTATPHSFFLPLISPFPLSVIGIGLCARIHLIKRTRCTHSPLSILTHIALSCGKTNCVRADRITSHLSPDSRYLAEAGVETVKGKQMKIK